MGLIEKQESLYKLTTFGSLVYKNHFETMENTIPNYWQIKSINVLKNRNDFPLEKKENIVNDYIATRVLDNAESEVYFATRYYDPHVSNLVFLRNSPRE